MIPPNLDRRIRQILYKRPVGPTEQEDEKYRDEEEEVVPREQISLTHARLRDDLLPHQRVFGPTPGLETLLV